MRNICIKKIFPLLLTVALLCMMGTTAMAAQEMPDLNKTGSISVTMKDSDSGKTVSGGTFTLYQVGDVLVNNGFSFVLTDAFSGSRLDVNDVESASLADNLAAYAKKNNLSGTPVSIGTDGIASFSNLSVGLYLLVQTEAAPNYRAVSPFLVSVPTHDASGYVYQVDATPKMEKVTVVPTTPAAPQQPQTPGKLPQTGQLNWPVPVLTVLGLLLFAAGWMLRYGRRKSGYEK